MPPKLRYGITTPIVGRPPAGSGDWEANAGATELVAIAEAADRLGYNHITASEHVALPQSAEGARGVTYWDSLATLSYLAARTTRIRLATNVLVLPYHHPLAIVKRYGTLDRLSGGRVILGVGVGSLVEEFNLLGAPMEDRGARSDDAMRAIRASFNQRVPSYSGPYYQFKDMIVEPCGVQAHVPMWVGGRSRRSLRRGVELGDGWMPFRVTLEDVSTMLGSLDIPPGFEVVLMAEKPFDPINRPDDVLKALEDMASAGATMANFSTVHHSLNQYLEQLHAFAELVQIPSA
jgi:probable F420-dependent oxidoreductase